MPQLWFWETCVSEGIAQDINKLLKEQQKDAKMLKSHLASCLHQKSTLGNLLQALEPRWSSPLMTGLGAALTSERIALPNADGANISHVFPNRNPATIFHGMTTQKAMCGTPAAGLADETWTCVSHFWLFGCGHSFPEREQDWCILQLQKGVVHNKVLCD